jgi:predicted signal transduction protein with EAL and GGDEF domain
MVVTGLVSHEEIAVRSSIGFYIFVPPGENERLIEQAGFALVSSEDVTAGAAAIAERWHDARERYRAKLVEREGDANFAGLQRFLACVQRVSAERRLSRYCYVAEKGA